MPKHNHSHGGGDHHDHNHGGHDHDHGHSHDKVTKKEKKKRMKSAIQSNFKMNEPVIKKVAKKAQPEQEHKHSCTVERPKHTMNSLI